MTTVGQPPVPAEPSPPASPPPFLMPGEVVKSSGKYAAGTPAAGIGQASKTFVKDEVVIRNTDSGKGCLLFFSIRLNKNEQPFCRANNNVLPFVGPVMGIKGRRVHLIEEISDTVISFQRGIHFELTGMIFAFQTNISFLPEL